MHFSRLTIVGEKMRGYYSVFNPEGKKIADCGIERDAVNLMHTRNKYWDGHYFTFNPLPGDIIDVESAKQLPTHDIVVNMDGGVGGSWEVESVPVLEENDAEVFIPE
tara:strand:+ start:1183 stop:1503 length:321 start_codon:yes stop_codon:yes gene_type:complete